jgi:hypothetical protein
VDPLPATQTDKLASHPLGPRLVVSNGPPTRCPRKALRTLLLLVNWEV